MNSPDAENECTLHEFAATFKTVEDAFYFLGFSSLEEIRTRRAQIAAAARSPITESPETPTPHFMVADVETNGGKGGQMVIQLAFILLDKDLNEISSYDHYLKLPDNNRYINPHAAGVHAITLDTLDREGIDPKEALAYFFKCVSGVKKHRDGKVVFHNAAFDSKAITHTAETIGYTAPFPFTAQSCFCTMVNSKSRLGLTDKIGRPKAPKNTELHEALVGPVPEGTKLHDALADVRVTAASFAAGVRAGWW
jgi:DNA polymerase III epsilon subunit-like protein